MDFDLDDPLGDLLSDGSNDSFFGTTKTKTTTIKPSTQTTGDTKSKSKVADLFGIDSENLTKPKEKLNLDINDEPKTNTTKEENAVDSRTNRRQTLERSTPERNVHTTNSSTAETAGSTANVQKKPMKKETRFDDSDDFLDDLGFDPKHPKGGVSGNAKKSNILDDILNFSRNEPATKPAPMPSAPKPTSAERSTRPTDSKPSTNRYSPSSRRQSRNLPRSGSGSLDADPLGLFSSPSQQDTKNDENAPKSKTAKKPTVDWLGLDAQSEAKMEEKVPIAQEIKQTIIETPKPEELPQKNIISSDAVTTYMNTTSIPTLPVNLPSVTHAMTADNISANLNMLNVASLEKEQALNSLQQQQTQLRVATQMKQQENILHDMHMKQENLIKQQEKQFNELLRRQVDRQSQLEIQIQRQQEQINAYINVLMNQPSIGMIATTKITPDASSQNDKEQSEESEGNASHQNVIELEATVKRLELDKLRLEDTLQSIQSSHEQELELLHISHKKQVHLLEESLESLEKRLREEIKSTETYHLNKISALQTDMETQRQKYEENIEKLITEYEKQIEKIRLNYEQDLEVLKNDQRSTIENIRQAKLYEFATLQESGSYLSTLKSASDNLEHATDNLQSMRINITSTIERIHTEREVQLNAKEQRLNDQQKTIEKTIEKTEEERTRLIELVKSLEIKLNSVEQSSTEEQWNFRQKSAALEAERVSFEREKSFTREKLATEEKRIQEMKEMQFVEHKRLMELLDAEREQILIEKAKLETMERLKVPTNTTRRQSELDAAIKIAQDAAKSADIEREKCIEQQRKHELKKRELMEKENMLQTQQNEVKLRVNEAKDQKQIAEHATKTCKTLEQKLLAKLQSLQENYMELTEREAKLSQTKMELGKERVELQHMRQQLRQSKCSLCRIGYKNAEISELDPLKDITTHDKSIPKFDFLSSNSFDGLQQRLTNVESMIDDVINVPQSSIYNLNSNNDIF